ncbi:hypothetical protein [Legionella sp. 28fT52]|uniref:hypothetical protein n=1 Tax=Legionella sp. 28fT52 TaxID=3410134 RepID=UPI003AF4DF1D
MSSTIQSVKKARISYFVPDAVLNDIKEKMISQGYDLKGKSKWISEAVQDLLEITNYTELVNISDQMQGFQKLDSVSVDSDLKQKLEEAIIEVRMKFPTIEGVQSKIIRTAIVQRLLR